MRIGILGGTFNPVHHGHIALAEFALQQLKLKKIIFVPANIAPLKSSRDLASGRQRLAMLKLAIGKDKRFAVSDIELKRGGISYTVDTLRSFSKKGRQLFFIAGSDSLTQLNRWKDFSFIQKLATFVVVARPHFKVGRLPAKSKFLRMPGVDVTSSGIRQRLARGESVNNLLDEKNLKYIREKGLYK